MTRKNKIKAYGKLYKRKFSWLDTCVYCGVKADCLDHVFPISKCCSVSEYLDKKSFIKSMFQGFNLVPCCNDCNNIARDKAFISIKEKRLWIQKQIRKKYKKTHRCVIWDSDDLKTVNGRLRQQIIKDMKNKYILDCRITYPAQKSHVDTSIF